MVESSEGANEAGGSISIGVDMLNYIKMCWIAKEEKMVRGCA
jgi:hypothetical protein